jgi:four helix bundle protein
MNNSDFAIKMKAKTKKFAIDTLKLCDELPFNKNSTRIISSQLGRSAASTGANYRAACVSRSDNEFYAKLRITIEEADESNYWFEVLDEGEFHPNKEKINELKVQGDEIIKILFSARNSIKNNKGNVAK